ncbi:MAG: hypothetical protein LBS56_03030 [Propionibacteriaceae bacterium]|jgi:hypothetical protein|nr:hypothetical protein [Propionibacteriaceae bacterium]
MAPTRSPVRNLLIVALLMTVGLSLAPYLVALAMDVLSITVHSATGWELGLGFVKNTLGVWPGGEVVAAVVFDDPLTTPALVSGLFQVLLVAFFRSLVPPLMSRANRDFRVMRLLRIGLLDGLVTCLIAIAVGWVFTLGPGQMFEGFLGVFAQMVVGFGSLAVIAVCALVALRVLRRGNIGFAFSLMTAVGRFALTTFALITWSVNNIAGAFVVVLCVFACGLLAFVDGRQSRYW